MTFFENYYIFRLGDNLKENRNNRLTSPDFSESGKVLGGIPEDKTEISGKKFTRQPEKIVPFYSYNSGLDKPLEERIRILEQRIEDSKNQIIGIYDLCKAIAYESKEREFQQCIDIADMILDHCWPNDRLLDNKLNWEDRQLFYMLEDIDLVATERKETLVYAYDDPVGREWLMLHWRLRKERILKSALEYEKWHKTKKTGEDSFIISDDYDIYKSDEVWKRDVGRSTKIS